MTLKISFNKIIKIFLFCLGGFDMWHMVTGYEGLYEIHVAGAVRSAKSKRVLSPISGKYVLSSGGVASRIAPETLRESIPVEALAEIVDDLDSMGYSPLFPWRKPDHSIAGYAGEYLVCYELCKRGVICAMNTIPNAQYDIIGDFGSGELFKVQVKANIKPKVKENKYPAEVGYHFKNVGKVRQCVDVFAFVALDRELVLFELADNSTSEQRSFSVPSFVARQPNSIDNVLQAVYGRCRVK